LRVPKWVFHRLQSSVSTFTCQYSLVSLKSSKSRLRILPRLPVIYILVSIFASIMCFRRQLLCMMWPIHSFFLLYVGYSSLPWLYEILTIGPTIFSNTTFQYFPSISDLLSEVFKFQNHTMLCSKCGTLLVSSLNLSPPQNHTDRPGKESSILYRWQTLV
jgi:hypothetical protein